MRRVGGLRAQFLAFENLYLAFRKSFRATKSYEAHRFYFYAERELFKLQKELAENRYEPRNYKYFQIRYPKERTIATAAFRDRVTHHALVNILEPIYELRFISDSYATRKGKGVHKAVLRAQRFLRSNKWFLKMDIKSYFASIDHSVLLNILAKKIKDPFILSLSAKILDKAGESGVGIPIGNLSSQFFANVYLDIFDHFIKEKLRIPYYLRYMDDFCIFSNRKEELKALEEPITDFLEEQLRLSLKDKARMLNTSLHGLSFLGTRVFPNTIRIKRENFQASYKKLRLREYQYKKGLISYERYHAAGQSLLAYLRYWQDYPLKTRLEGRSKRKVKGGRDVVSLRGSNRVLRGGSWNNNNNNNNLRVGNRGNNNPQNENNNWGLRLSSTGAS